ncbi:MAG: hypothetical protein DHS80DRAFT_23997 [Piptocephalis tieghemiana]|nr:MAG: hypothetical protein DHS80DRAFT_23997 [Piptocephalis tieghemiana]
MPATNFEELIAQAKAFEVKADAEETPDEDTLHLYEQALDAYASASALQPKDEGCLYNWGRISFILAGFLDEVDPEAKADYLTTAMDKFRAALEISPEHSECCYTLAQALIASADHKAEEEEDDEGANADLTEASQLFTRVFSIQEAQMAKGEPKEDPMTEDNLVDTLVGHCEALNSLAYLTDSKDAYEAHFTEAIKLLERAIALRPSRKSELLQEWAGVLESRAEKRGDEAGRVEDADYDEALAKLDEACKEDPKNADAFCDKGDLLLTVAHARLITAAIDADQSEEAAISPEKAAAAESAVWEGYGLACTAYEKAAELEPESVGILQKLGDLCFTRSRLQMTAAKEAESSLLAKAEEWYRAGLAKDDGDEELIVRLAQVLFAQGGTKAAEVDALIIRFKELGGLPDDVIEEPELFEEDFITKVAEHFPEDEFDDEDDEDESDEE